MKHLDLYYEDVCRYGADGGLMLNLLRNRVGKGDVDVRISMAEVRREYGFYTIAKVRKILKKLEDEKAITIRHDGRAVATDRLEIIIRADLIYDESVAVEGSLFESQEYKDFISWVYENAGEIMGMKQPLTEEEYYKLKDCAEVGDIKNVLMNMANNPNIKKKYISTYRTALNWLRMRGKLRQKQDASTNPYYDKFLGWCKENAPVLLRMEKPLTEQEFLALRKEFGSRELADVLIHIGNQKDLNERKVSVYLTAGEILKKRKEESMKSNPLSVMQECERRRQEGLREWEGRQEEKKEQDVKMLND